MSETALSIIKFLIGVALFITGMSIMSSGLKKATGKRIKRLFNKIGDSIFASLGIGAGVTAIVQSSGATSVMAIGFMNAKVMSIFQGVVIMLGAFIGTTATGLLVSLSSLPSLSQIMALTVVVGVILSFFKKEKLKYLGEVLIGLGILFVGLDMMKGAFTGEFLSVFQNLLLSVNFPILLFLIGMLFTCLTQSSSATSGIVIVMVGQNALSMADGFYIVLGATVGTIMVSIIASIGGSVEAKRAVCSITIIRVITGLLALFITWIIEACTNNGLSNGLNTMFGGNSEVTVAMYLVFYNLIFVGLAIPFVKPSLKLSNRLVRDKQEELNRKSLLYIDNNLLITPTVALGMAKKEIGHMLELSKINITRGFKMILNRDFEEEDELEETEDTIDYLNKAITDYLIRLSTDATFKEEKKVGAYFHVINDIERIGDHGYNFYETAKWMRDEDLSFSDVAKDELNRFFEVIIKMFDVADDIFMNNKQKRLNELDKVEDEADKIKQALNDGHYDRVTKNLCTIELSPVFTTVVADLERVGDHLVNVGYARINPTGDTNAEVNSNKQIKAKKSK